MKKISLIIVLIMLILFLCGCMNINKNKTDLNQKVNTEISYMDNELISIANSINNISYSNYKINVQEVQNKSSESSSNSNKEKSSSGEESQQGEEEEKSNDQSEEKIEQFSLNPNTIIGNKTEINWKELKRKIELFYSSWMIISKDLKQTGVDDSTINGFGKELDSLAIAIKNEDKNKTLESVIVLYKYLPEFIKLNKNDDNNNKNNKNVEILETKYNLLICYKNVNLDEWEQLPKSITDLRMSFSNIYNKRTEFKGQEINIDSILMLINEINNIPELKEKEIFYIKYKNMLQELNIISAI